MALDRKRLRYAYWLALAFMKKNIQLIILSFIFSAVAIIILVSFSPYLIKALTNKKEVIGIAGTYTVDTIPEPILQKISNGLLYINEKGTVIPLLTESWKEVDKGSEYRFQLKKDLLWNDGKPFLAEDINYQFKDIEKKLEGGLTFSYKLQRPFPLFPTFLTRPIVRKPLIGVAGLYKVEKAKIKAGEVQELQLTPNKPELPILIYKFYDTETKLINAYKLGEITQMQTTKKTVADSFARWKNTNVDKQVDYSKVMTLFFNMENPLLKEEKDLRHAIAMAINNKEYAALGDNARGPLPPTSWAYQPAAKQYTYDPDLASKLLNKYKDSSESANLSISTYYDNLSLADILQKDIQKQGLTTKVNVIEGNLTNNFDLFLAVMQIPDDPDQYFFWHSTQRQTNITNYKNVRVDKVLEDGRTTFKLDERKKLYADFQKVITDDMPAYFLYHPYIYTIQRK